MFKYIRKHRKTSKAISTSTDETNHIEGKELHILTKQNVSQLVVKAEYAVRGQIVALALEIEQRLNQRQHFPFDKLVYCNIGNPQQLQQKPITFARQVLSILSYPALLENENVSDIFPVDVIKRATRYHSLIDGGSGSYSHSQGALVFRKEIAEFIEKRDGGIPSDPENIFITNGASPAIQNVIQLLIRTPSDGIMLPVPEYPLYAASTTLCNGTQVDYFLDEDNDWHLDLPELKRSFSQARSNGIHVRAIIVTNPGNPTGQCLSRNNMVEIINFCVEHKIVLLADEVYQDNVWTKDRKFLSFKQVSGEMGVIGKGFELFSFHSVSKGFFGECGRRGGYLEIAGCHDDIRALLYKLSSVSLCSNLDGQIMLGLMVNPPKDGDPSYPLYAKEKTDILSSLDERAHILHDAFQKMQGVRCNLPQGALYLFPTIVLPANAVKAANEEGIKPDTHYCATLLKKTGIVIVPGSGFGQKNGTFHFRTTILPKKELILEMIEAMQKFHKWYMEEYK